MKRVVLIAAWLGLATAQAAISFGPAGTGIVTFDTLPTATEWATYSIAGASGSISTAAALDAAVQTNSASSFLNALLVENSTSPVPHTMAGWSSVRHAVYTGPAGVTAEMILATLRNDAVGTLSSIQLAYDLDAVPTNQFTQEEIPGQRVYFSLTGAPGSWQFIPSLSGDIFPGPRAAVVDLGAWPPGANLYLLWAQDNAAHSPDACYLIDNFYAGPELPPPPCFQTQPASTTVLEGQPATFSTAPCSFPPYVYQWFKNGAPIEGAHSASYAIDSAQPSDQGIYYVTLSNTGGTLASTRATLTVIPDDEPPRALLAYRVEDMSNFSDTIVVVFSERVELSSATDIKNYALRGTVPGDAPAILEAAVTNESNVVLSCEPIGPGLAWVLDVLNVEDQSSAHHRLRPNPTTLPLQSFNPPAIAEDHVWKYFEAPTNTAWPGWMERGYDDSSWISGRGAFGIPLDEAVPAPFVLRTMIRSPDAGGPITTYFRTWFNVGQTNAMVRLTGVFDEGAIAYLNGTEIWRVRLPSGPVTTSTVSSNAVEPHVLAGPLDLLGSGRLQPGANCLAVELHQVSPVSGDAVMGLTLELTESVIPCVPVLGIARSGNGSVNVNWSCGGTLQVSPQPAGPPESWHDVLTATNSFATNLTAGALFFRVRL